MDGHPVGFDWAGLYERLGEAEADLSARDYAGLTTALSQLLDWVLRADLKGKHSLEIIARRALALAWTLSPAYIEGSPSLTRLANDLGVHKTAMSSHSAEAHRRFGVGNRAQVGHGWNFRKEAQQ